MANRGRVIYELGDYKELYKDVFVRAAIREVGPNFNYEPNAGISHNELASIRPMSFAPKIKSAERITVSNLISAKRYIPNDTKLNFGDSAAPNLLPR